MDRLQRKAYIYSIIELSRDGDMASRSYDIMMNVAVVVGLIPLCIKGTTSYTAAIDVVTSLIFLGDYILRIYTSDYKMGIFSAKAYFANILSPMEVVDLLSILPVLSLLFPVSSVIRLLKLLRIFRVFKLVRYSKTMTRITNVLRRVKGPLSAVLILAMVYIFVIAALIFQAEPDTFPTFFDAIYWATISLTTVGYGDYVPVTFFGKAVAGLSNLVGVAVIALPSGIITAAYMNEITKVKGKHEL
jgi:voltage-gated potassium channel